jgi:CxxC motif-containing protein (DUF1111 family)
MSYNVLRFVSACMLSSIAGVGVSGQALAQVKDPGVRTLTPAQIADNAASPLTAQSLADFGLTLDPATKGFFTGATAVFQEIDDVPAGLGPRFNSNGCGTCHAFPILGGTSPPLNQFGFTGNPQVQFANSANTLPSFITAGGPVREARFVGNPDGTLDGGVHDLFTISGRADAPGCNIAQPNFAQQVANTNVIFRIPTPTFGLGLVENVPDSGLVAAANAQARLGSTLGITSGEFNHSGNDGTITRFGWKAQNKSLLIFAGEAYNVEQGVTNEAFSNERDETASCQFNPLPEDKTPVVNKNHSGSNASDFSADVVNFAAFMRLSSPPQPATPFNASQSRGQTVFFNIGCGVCHIQNQTTSALGFTNIDPTTGNPVTPPQPPVTFQPYSDFALHDMGGGLADGVIQGGSEPDQFRSAPLWGVGQRVFFMHDGRASDLLQAILAHNAPAPSPQTTVFQLAKKFDTDATITHSQAAQVINNFNALSPTDQQNVLNFLRAL